MGGDKAAVEVLGSTMLERVATALEPVVDRIVVLGPARPGWESWPDEIDAHGPLAGIATALGKMGEGRALVLAVDQPFARSRTLQELAGIRSELPVVPVDRAGTRQVTCAVYPARIAQQAHDEAIIGGSIQSLLDRVAFEPVTPDTWVSWGEDGRSWFSVDTTEDHVLGLHRFNAP